MNTRYREKSLNSSALQSELVSSKSAEQTHTQAVAVSWLVQSLLSSINPTQPDYILYSTWAAWLKKYENYPQDALLESIKVVYLRLVPHADENQIRSFMQHVYDSYIYDR